jgi:RNA polymerase sigma factor (sigma-70 family)
MQNPSPFSDVPAGDELDRQLVQQAKGGNREALESLVRRHQPWIYNVALRMRYWPHEAEDTTQEILIKLITKLSTFQGRSSFRTWLYRIVINHVLNQRQRDLEDRLNFEDYGRGLDGAPDLDLPDPRSVPVDVALLIQEAEIGCTSGMLLCLDREQRIIYILGEIFGVTDVVGAEFFEITRENFRQKLARARRDLHNFMQDKCGLVNQANPCRCARKTQAFINAGLLDPAKLLFAREHVTRVKEVAPKTHQDLNTLDEAYAEVHRAHPFQRAPDFAAALRDLLNRAEFKSIVEME